HPRLEDSLLKTWNKNPPRFAAGGFGYPYQRLDGVSSSDVSGDLAACQNQPRLRDHFVARGAWAFIAASTPSIDRGTRWDMFVSPVSVMRNESSIRMPMPE